MIKKTVVFLFIVGLSGNGFAAPSAKILGNNKSNSASVKMVTNTPAKTTKINANATTSARVVKTPIAKNGLSATTSRVPVIHNLKSGTKPAGVPGSTTSAVSKDTFDEMVNRIEDLENKNANAITDVVENEPGTYVTDVAVDGNKLNVTKTRLLYVPVRNENSERITGDAEIWIVK